MSSRGMVDLANNNNNRDLLPILGIAVSCPSMFFLAVLGIISGRVIMESGFKRLLIFVACVPISNT
jgi:hypothetical protein